MWKSHSYFHDGFQIERKSMIGTGPVFLEMYCRRLINFSLVTKINLWHHRRTWERGIDLKSAIEVHSELRGLSTMKFAFQVPFCLVYIPARKYLKSAIRQLTKADLRVKFLAVGHWPVSIALSFHLSASDRVSREHGWIHGPYIWFRIVYGT